MTVSEGYSEKLMQYTYKCYRKIENGWLSCLKMMQESFNSKNKLNKF